MNRVRTGALAWDAVAVARPGMSGRAIRELGCLGRFVNTGYPLLLAGKLAVEGDPRDAVRAAVESGEIGKATARVLPCEGTVGFEGDDVTETLCEALEGECFRLAGQSFYVRASLRGLKGRLTHPAVERALGAFLYEGAAAVGPAPSVRFKDADFAVVIEVIGKRAGWAFLDRAARTIELIKVR